MFEGGKQGLIKLHSPVYLKRAHQFTVHGKVSNPDEFQTIVPFVPQLPGY